jgi:NitT/TauT family transport system ATP-binding protein
VKSARPGRIIETRKVNFARPRDLDVCYEKDFTDTVQVLRHKIAEVRKA